MDSFEDDFVVDEDKNLLDLYRAGSVISYISMLMNIVIFTILCRKALRSPATILMQGLAVADLLTAISCYGLEPIFLSQYVCHRLNAFYACYLPYPYCSISPHLSILSFTFHNVSAMITTCLGIQKVIAILFPVWTKNELTRQRAAICCVICFLLSIAIGIPRHFSIWSESDEYFSLDDKHCVVYSGGNGIVEYSSVTYLLIQTVLLTSCCLVMLISTIFIVYKLITNKFGGRMTNQRRQERRSVAMVILLLMIFIITEVPKVFVSLGWCFEYLYGHSLIDFPWRVVLIQRYEYAMSLWLEYFTDSFISYNDYSGYFIFAMLMEGIRLFTIIGCMSNFIIYIMMSTKMRNEIVLLLKKIITRCTHKDQMHEIRETRRGRTQLTGMITTERPGHRRAHEIDMNTTVQPGHRRAHEIEMNTTVQPGQNRSYEIEMNTTRQPEQNRSHDVEMNTSEQQDQNCSHEIEMNTSEYQGQSLTDELEMNTSAHQGQTCSHEMDMNTSEHQGHNRSHEIEMNTSEHQGQSRTHEVEINTIEQPRQSRTHKERMHTLEQPEQNRSPEIEMYTSKQPGQRCTHEVDGKSIEQTGQGCTHEVDRKSIEQTGQSCTHEVDRKSIEQTGRSRSHEIEMNTSKQPRQSRSLEIVTITEGDNFLLS
ncbi:unnamed protein product [Mytilus edulis]|uniref:G-protein coupled receptors family 1 profile domain-containing protein n=1 Tax=Mytilus edulis TaxID=6550 RepID=A0A8S3RH88_MYTED|nr:unnamed protein product [Mytilus edulis]